MKRDVPIAIELATPSWKSLRGSKAAVLRAAHATLPKSNTREVTILLASDVAMKRLNTDWRGKTYATNVLSFPSAGLGAVTSLGDIAIGYGVVKREAKAQGKPILHHLQHLVVHGILHLRGYDHETDKDAARMERTERRILKSLGVPDPYTA